VQIRERICTSRDDLADNVVVEEESATTPKNLNFVVTEVNYVKLIFGNTESFNPKNPVVSKIKFPFFECVLKSSSQ
jgi:hypothetical protein